MKYIRQACVIFGITMIGEFLNYALPLPIPGGVYGLFLMLIALCTGVIKLSDVEETANFLLDTMSIMFVPATVGLIEHVDLLKAVIIPFSIIVVISTVIVMAVTGKVTQLLIHKTGKRRTNNYEQSIY
ncbi:MAG: CidA/LrgA family protein [Lachnospiraceae bacterium]